MSEVSEFDAESLAPGPAAPSFRVPLIISLALAAASLGLVFWAWQQLPPDARVPVHWNAAGQIDGRAGRHSLLLMPATMLAMTLLFVALPRIEPRRGNLLRSSKAYKAVWLSVLTFFAGMNALIVLAALGRPAPMDKFCAAGIGAMFLVLGNYLGKVRSNFVFGIRTPWTLSSELAWNKTHRLGGWMFVVLGFALIASAWAPVPGAYLFGAILGGVGVLTVTVVAYSYFVWRGDTNKAMSISDTEKHRGV